LKAAAALAALIVAGAPAPALSAQASATLQGEVLETRSVEIYTYLRLKTAAGEIWAAVPRTDVTKGTQVTIGDSMTMQNFESKTLNKTFDKIVFGQLVDPRVKAAAPGVVAPGTTAGLPPVKVTKATGPDARTVAEVVKARAALSDKAVLVRAQVVKANLGIMGKNWLHLRDGSGSASDGTNDILVTTKEVAAVGDIVNVKGTVRTDVKLGAGYDYAVLIENAVLQK